MPTAAGEEELDAANLVHVLRSVRCALLAVWSATWWMGRYGGVREPAAARVIEFASLCRCGGVKGRLPCPALLPGGVCGLLVSRLARRGLKSLHGAACAAGVSRGGGCYINAQPGTLRASLEFWLLLYFEC